MLSSKQAGMTHVTSQQRVLQHITAHSKAYSVAMTRAFLPFTPRVVKTPRQCTRRGKLAAAFRAASSQCTLSFSSQVV